MLPFTIQPAGQRTALLLLFTPSLAFALSLSHARALRPRSLLLPTLTHSLAHRRHHPSRSTPPHYSHTHTHPLNTHSLRTPSTLAPNHAALPLLADPHSEACHRRRGPPRCISPLLTVAAQDSAPAPGTEGVFRRLPPFASGQGPSQLFLRRVGSRVRHVAVRAKRRKGRQTQTC